MQPVRYEKGHIGRAERRKGKKDMKTTTLLTAAGILMLLSAAIFAISGSWIYAALLGAGGFGCLAGALNFRSRE